MPSDPTSATQSHVPRSRRDRRQAVCVLLCGRTTADRAQAAGVDRFLDYVRDQDLRLFLKTGQEADGKPLAAAGLAGPGRAAMILASPRERPEPSAAAVELLQSLTADLEGVRVAQALLELDPPGHQSTFEAAGYERLATLVYLTAPAPSAPPPAPLPGFARDLRALSWSEATRPLFEQAVAETYVDTLDCPGLVGRRPMDEVLAGHRAAGGPGAFAATRWQVFCDASGPAAVLLLARLPHENTLEVVYLGVCPSWRGRGLGRWLLQLSNLEAFRSGASRVALAADAANRPALRLYRSAGFRTLQRRAALACFRSPEGEKPPFASP